MTFGWFWGDHSLAAIFEACRTHLIVQLAKNSLLRCDSDYDKGIPGEGSLIIVEISRERVYVVTAMKLAAVVVSAK